MGVAVSRVRGHRLQRSPERDLPTDFHNTSVTEFQNPVQ
jgi:hypothetical protein